jgi:hypothetical protein
MNTFEQRRIEFYLVETDEITDVWGGESSGDEYVVKYDNWSDHNIFDHIIETCPVCNNKILVFKLSLTI